MHNIELEKILNNELNCQNFNDYVPNGLQVEGRPTVQKVVTGVTASQALVDAAIDLNADAILVHHGYFWKNEPVVIKGIKKNRIKSLLVNDINLFAYHLPLDAHPVLGNNAQLGNLLGIHKLGTLLPEEEQSLVLHGDFDRGKTPEEVTERLESIFGRKVLHSGGNAPASIRHIAWCCGGGQHFIQQAAEQGAHAFITGEVSEQTIHIAREMGIHFYACGHHATERYGVKALGEWLASHYDLKVTFVDIDNPA